MIKSKNNKLVLLFISIVVLSIMASDGKSTTSALIVGLALPLYIILIFIPSLLLNGLILITFAKTKKRRTPSNLLSVHISIIALISILFYSTLSIPAFALSVINCDCDLTYYKWLLAHIFHFALYPLNIAAISASYCLILKYSSSILTFPRVIAVLIGIWIASVIGNVPTVFLVPLHDFVTCCEGLCINDTYICDDLTGAFTPNLFSIETEIFFIIQDIVFIIAPCILVFVFTALSFYIFKSSILHPKSSLKRRMFLLPIVMTVADIVLIVGQNIINWAPITTHTDNVPGDIIPLVFGLSWDLSNLIYPIIILYFNVPLRKACWSMVKCSHDSEDSYGTNTKSVKTQDEKTI